jgi:hypothetical protein
MPAWQDSQNATCVVLACLWAWPGLACGTKTKTPITAHLHSGRCYSVMSLTKAGHERQESAEMFWLQVQRSSNAHLYSAAAARWSCSVHVDALVLHG